MKLNIKTGDLVEVISGKEKGKRGKVTKAFPKENKVVVQGVNIVTKATRPTQKDHKADCLSVLSEAKELFVRVKTESDDAELVQLSLCMEACCALMMGNPNEVIELLEGTRKKIISSETILASAYQ